VRRSDVVSAVTPPDPDHIGSGGRTGRAAETSLAEAGLAETSLAEPGLAEAKLAQAGVAEAQPAAETVTPDITGIIVPVPQARRFAPHPHITLLAPFRDPSELVDDSLRADLRAVFASTSPFHFRLVEVRRFPDDHLYLVPEPDEPFRAMTIELSHRYPDCPPYGGAFSEVIPHLTIDPDTRPHRLPIEAHATVTQLVHSHGEEWDVLATFPLAGAAVG
jgi:2'-5' RNA ligase